MKLLLLAFFVSSSVCLAQYTPLGPITFWADGYIVTVENDTVRGKIRIGMLVNDSPATILVRGADDKKVSYKGEAVRLIAQRLPDYAYSTGAIPREREMVVFEQVPNPRKGGKPVLLERLTRPGGKIALYFDVSGWKKTTEYSFGNFTLSSDTKDLSYIVVKNGSASWLVKKGTLEEFHETIFGDCPAFVQHYPAATRKDWKRFGEMVDGYNELCVIGAAVN